jgi:hypothetical protein
MTQRINCDSCPHWDLSTVRYRGRPEGLCRCPDSIDVRRYVSAYHTCSQHPGFAELAHDEGEKAA